MTAIPIGPHGRALIFTLPDHCSDCWCELAGNWQSGASMRDLPLATAPVWRRRTPAPPVVVEVWG
ncbi:MAG: hypothetical protein ACRDS0_38385 [Pseudonocardiaceae bacterium]